MHSLLFSSEPSKDIQKLLKPSSSGDLSKELLHIAAGDEESSLSGHTAASLLHIAEKRREYPQRRWGLGGVYGGGGRRERY